MTAEEPQRIFVVSFVSMRGGNPIIALRHVLKIALRQFGLRCINVEEKTGSQT